MDSVDQERRIALADLMQRPDPPELKHRGHRVTCEGRVNRRRELNWLSQAYTSLVCQDRHDESDVVRG